MKLTGDRNQCPTCNEFFNSTAAFVKHRAGRVATPERRCLTPDEMTAAGMAKNTADFWVTALMPSDAREAVAQESISSSSMDT